MDWTWKVFFHCRLDLTEYVSKSWHAKSTNKYIFHLNKDYFELIIDLLVLARNIIWCRDPMFRVWFNHNMSWFNLCNWQCHEFNPITPSIRIFYLSFCDKARKYCISKFVDWSFNYVGLPSLIQGIPYLFNRLYSNLAFWFGLD